MAQTLQHYYNEALVLSRDRKFGELKKFLFDVKLEKFLIPEIPKILMDIDPFIHTYLFIHFANSVGMGDIYKSVDILFRCFDVEQISLNIKSFIELAESFKDFLSNKKMLIKGLKTMQSAVEILDEADFGLTRVHNIFLQMCLQCKMYRLALGTVKNPVTKLSQKQGGANEDVFTYYYYSGMVFLGLKIYNMALESFSSCLSVQMKDVHPAMIESRKKYILLLIRQNKKTDQKLKEVQNSNQGFFQSIIDPRCTAYNELKKEETCKSIEAWDKQIETSKKEISADKNMGLCKQARLSIYRKELKELKKVYTLYTLDELKTKLNIPNEQTLITLLLKLNDIKKIGRIDLKLRTFEFVKKSEINYEKDIIQPLELKFKLMKKVTEEYSKEHEVLLKEVTLNPENFFTYGDKII